jgi:hypothetical protein
MRTDIGTAYIEYDEAGNVTGAEFKPLIQESFEEVLARLKAGNNPDNDEDKIKANAEEIMAGWFSKTTAVELADRTKFELKSEREVCEHYDAVGNIKRIGIIFYLEAEESDK